MIKKCKVLIRNELVMVVDYDGEKVQLPSSDVIEDEVYIKYEDNKYYLSSKSESENIIKPIVEKVEEAELAHDPAAIKRRTKASKTKS